MSVSKKNLKQKINKINNDLLKMNFSELNKFINDIDDFLINENTISCIIKKFCELNQYDAVKHYFDYFIEKKKLFLNLGRFLQLLICYIKIII